MLDAVARSSLVNTPRKASNMPRVGVHVSQGPDTAKSTFKLHRNSLAWIMSVCSQVAGQTSLRSP